MRFTAKFALVALAVTATARADGQRPLPSPDANVAPAYVLEIPEDLDGVLIADAAASALLRFARKNGRLSAVESRYMSVGLRGVGKQRAWDRKTPLGIYFATEELDTTYLDPKYGAAAFVLDYPNVWDRAMGRTGDGIWLHGVHPDTPVRPPRDTDGCLALPNDELLALRSDLNLHRTPVIVAREIEWASQDELDRLAIDLRAALERWRHSIEQADIHAYLSLYSDEFAARGMSKRDWARFRYGSFRAADAGSVSLGDVMLLRDPRDADLYLAHFTQTSTGVAGRVSVRKRLYWRLNDADWLIVSEDSG